MSTPRSLADDLRGRDDDALAALLTLRPDLVRPAPSDITVLTGRATSSPSLARCLDGLDALTLHVLATAVELTQRESDPRETSPSDAVSDAVIAAHSTAGLGDDPEAAMAVQSSLQRLVELALLWGTPERRHVVQGVRELMRGLPMLAWPVPVLEESDEAGSASLARLTDVDALCALHAHDLIVAVRDLLDSWSAEPPQILRTGGLALRDLAMAGRVLHCGPAEASTVIEVAHAAALVADDQDEPAHWVPTDGYDAWQALRRPEQWLALVHAWLRLPRLASLADERTQVLVDSRDRRVIPSIRRAALGAWAAAGAGHAVTPAALERVLDHAEPRRAGELRHLTVVATVREAEQLGLAVGGVLCDAARALLDDGLDARNADAQARAAVHDALPAEIDHVLIQADLTIVAPGPLDIDVARQLRIVADVESRGHATVYRASEESLTRALDAGWDADAIVALFTQVSRTPVPQALSYLVHDVARRHGAVRVGNALGYVRCDNADTLATALHDRRLAKLSLRRIADTVLVSHYPASDIITALRAAGYSPAAEGADGTVLVHRPNDRRTRTPKAPRVTARRDDALVSAAIRALRASDRSQRPRTAAAVAGPASAGAPSLSSAAVSTTIKKAVLEHQPLWIGYAEVDGTVTEQVVDPIRISAGTLTAFDHRSETVRTFAVARVTGVAPAEA